MLPEQRDSKNSDQTKLNIKVGDNFLREQLSNTTQALKGVTSQNNKLTHEVKELKKQRLATSISVLLLLLAGLSWFTYTTYLYIDMQNKINTPTAIASTYNTRNLSLPKVRQLTAKQEIQQTPKKPQKGVVKQVISKSFMPNELLESRLNSKSSYLTPLQKEGFIHPAGDELAISFLKDSSLTKQDLLIMIRSNDTFAEPVQQDTVKASITSYTKLLNRKDFKRGLYYIEIVSDQTLLTLFTGKFTIEMF